MLQRQEQRREQQHARTEADRLTAEYLRHTDPFTGLPVSHGDLRMCGRCKAGPWRKRGCNDMRRHNNNNVPLMFNASRRTHNDNSGGTPNRCTNCFWFDADWNKWPVWDRVMGPH